MLFNRRTIFITCVSCCIILALLKISRIEMGKLNQQELEEEIDGFFSAKVIPLNGNNIFFLDTSTSTENVTINARQACAIESAAISNPLKRIFFVYKSKERFKSLTMTKHLEMLMSFPNILITFIDLEKLSVGSPVENFIKSGKLATSEFIEVHTSHILRILLLWKYGGTYIDTDMIVMKKFDSSLTNFACPESEDYMSNAIINLDQKHGKKYAEIFLEDIATNFNASIYSQTGPFSITRVLKNLCNVEKFHEAKECLGFHVLPKEKCYAIEWRQWEKLMNENDAGNVMQEVKDSIVVHFWNKFLKTITLNINSKAPYVQLAKEFCPKTIATCGEYF
jgi:lactosylceramide 4-alpha-galactosyltransferase